GSGRRTRRRTSLHRSPWRGRRRGWSACRWMRSSWAFLPGGLTQGADDGAPRQLDLEVVVAEALRVTEERLGNPPEIVPGGTLAQQQLLGLPVTPGLVRHAAQRQSHFLDHP